jgi:Replication-relaxation
LTPAAGGTCGPPSTPGPTNGGQTKIRQSEVSTLSGDGQAVWWSERQATSTFGKIVRPDGYGEWVEHCRQVGFFLELDQGTEPLPRLLNKLTGYSHLTELGIHHPLLILLPTSVRESHLHERRRADPRLDRRGGAGLIVATAAADQLATAGASPANTVWLRPQRRRARLIDLTHPDSRAAAIHESR